MPLNGTDTGDGWAAWAKYVLETLRELKTDLTALARGQAEIRITLTNLCSRTEVQSVKDDVLKLKTQAGVWGAIFGMAAGLGGQLIVWLIKGGGGP